MACFGRRGGILPRISDIEIIGVLRFEELADSVELDLSTFPNRSAFTWRPED